MDTPLHKSYVHYQHQAMVTWEREKNPLCIQNCCRSDLLQSLSNSSLTLYALFKFSSELIYLFAHSLHLALRLFSRNLRPP